MIKIDNITFAYNKENVFEEFSLEIPRGLVYLRGSNGIGKSTLLNLIMGINKIRKGDILIDDQSIKDRKLGDIARLNGYLYQNFDVMLFANTIYEELSFPMQLKKVSDTEIQDKVMSVLDKFDLIDYKDRYPLTLSIGQRQRLAIACIYIMQPQRFLLDEPTSRLDGRVREEFYDIVRTLLNEGKDVIIATHDIELMKSVTGKIIDMDELLC